MVHKEETTVKAKDISGIKVLSAMINVGAGRATWAEESEVLGVKPRSRNGAGLRDEAHRRFFPKTLCAPRGMGSKV